MHTTSLTSPTWKDWLPVISLAFAAFIFNTTEFVPISLLTDISKTFEMKETQTGLMMTGYAWFVAVASLPLMLLTTHIERRKLMLFLLILFIASHVLSAVAWSFGVLMVARIGIACAHSIFWAITAAMAVRLAPKGYQARALGFIVTGCSLAVVLGLPLGRMIGQQLGWKMTFLVIGVLALLILLLLVFTLPQLPANNAGSAKNLPSLLKRPALLTIYAVTIFTVLGHFTIYSYIEPFLQNIAKFNANFTTVFLLVFGLSSIGGSMLYSRVNHRFPFGILVLPIAVIGFCMFVFLFASANVYITIVICMIWGCAMAPIMLSLQTKVLEIAPDATDVASAIYSGIFNIGIGGGALIGSQVSQHWSMSYIGFTGAVFTAIAFTICIVLLRRYLNFRAIPV